MIIPDFVRKEYPQAIAALPEGYYFILVGDKIKKGDKFYNPLYKDWQTVHESGVGIEYGSLKHCPFIRLGKGPKSNEENSFLSKEIVRLTKRVEELETWIRNMKNSAPTV